MANKKAIKEKKTGHLIPMWDLKKQRKGTDKTQMRHQSNSTACRMFALHITELDLIFIMLMASWAPAGVVSKQNPKWEQKHGIWTQNWGNLMS